MKWRKGSRMIDARYLRYLLKQRKVALLFFFVLYALVSFTPMLFSYGGQIAAWFAYLMSSGLCMVLPAVVFGFVQRKRTVDVYFALPVERKRMLHTGLLFSWGIVSVYFSVTVLLLAMVGNGFDYLLQMMLGALFSFAVQTMFFSMVFLLGNHLFDGIVMILGYAVFPFFLHMAIEAVSHLLMPGFTITAYGKLDFSQWLSPAWVGLSIFAEAMNLDFVETRAYLPACLMIAIISYYGLKKNFTERKTERAEMLSDHPFAYRLLIRVYMALCLLVAGCTIMTIGFKDNLVYYPLLLFLYVVSFFVYKRKISLDYKMVAEFVVGALLGIGIAYGIWATRGFGIVDHRNYLDGEYIRYEYSWTQEARRLEDYYEVQFELLIPTDELKENKELLDLLEGKRKECIDDFYHREKGGEGIYRTFLYLSRGKNEDDSVTKAYDFYDSALPFTFAELELIDRYGDVTVYSDGHDYEPLKDYLERKRR